MDMVAHGLGLSSGGMVKVTKDLYPDLLFGLKVHGFAQHDSLAITTFISA